MGGIPVSFAPGDLLEQDESPPFEVAGHDGRSPFVVICDHAGRRLPRALGALGLPEAELVRHIAWDIGAGGVARRLATRAGRLRRLPALFAAGHRLQPPARRARFDRPAQRADA